MKTILSFAFMVFVCLAACTDAGDAATKNTGPVLNEEAETAAILEVINKETNSFFKGDYEGWASTWAHAPYAMQAWNNDDGTYSAAIGWDSINAQGKGWIEKYYKNGENVIHPDVKKEKPLIKFFSNTSAYLIWKQYNADKDKKQYQVSQETRLMEKQADGWKIVNVTGLWNSKLRIPADSIKIPE